MHYIDVFTDYSTRLVYTMCLMYFRQTDKRDVVLNMRLAECALLFVSDDLVFHPGSGPCGDFTSLYCDFGFCMVVFSIAFIMDVITIVQLRQMRKRVASTLSIDMKKQRYRVEAIMTVQTFLTTLLRYVNLFAYHIISLWIQMTPMLTFLFTNFLWCAVLAGGGYITALVNADIRNTVLHPFRPPQSRSSLSHISKSHVHNTQTWRTRSKRSDYRRWRVEREESCLYGIYCES